MECTYSYYGRIDKKMPKKKIAETMLDDHVINIIEKEKEKLRVEFATLIKEIKVDALSELASFKKQVNEMKKKLDIFINSQINKTETGNVGTSRKKKKCAAEK